MCSFGRSGHLIPAYFWIGRLRPTPAARGADSNFSEAVIAEVDRGAKHTTGAHRTESAQMQASLAVLSGALGLLSAWISQDWRWTVGAVQILSNWPYTVIGIMPTNRKLKAIAVGEAGPSARGMLEMWGRLHAVQTVLGIAAAAAYLWALH